MSATAEEKKARAVETFRAARQEVTIPRLLEAESSDEQIHAQQLRAFHS